jgi:hypothetical protein
MQIQDCNFYDYKTINQRKDEIHINNGRQ